MSEPLPPSEPTPEAATSSQVEPAPAVPTSAEAAAVEPASEADAPSPIEAGSAVDAAPAGEPTVATATLSPAECADALRRRFPALFGGAPKPLKLRVQVDIQERAPGVFSKQALSAFFRRYTGSTSYLMAIARGTQRFDLDGQASGELSDEHRQIAATELARRRAGQDERRALEMQQRRNRATLLHDFQITTLTPANFCALKGIAVEELDGLLAIARQEAQESPREPAAPHREHRPGRPPQAAHGPRDRPDGRAPGGAPRRR